MDAALESLNTTSSDANSEAYAQTSLIFATYAVTLGFAALTSYLAYRVSQVKERQRLYNLARETYNPLAIPLYKRGIQSVSPTAAPAA